MRSRACFEIPRMASRSSTRWKGPLFSRKLTIDFAVAGPMPGTCCNCSTEAELRSTGFAGGFFFCARAAPLKRKSSDAAARINANRAMLLLEFTCSRSVEILLFVAVSVVFGEFTEQRGLFADLISVADDYDLRVGRIEIFSRRQNDIVGGERVNSLAICFQMIFRQAIQINCGKLAQHSILRRHSQRKHSSEIAARAFQFFTGNRQRTHAIHFVKYFR